MIDDLTDNFFSVRVLFTPNKNFYYNAQMFRQFKCLLLTYVALYLAPTIFISLVFSIFNFEDRIFVF